MGKWVRGYPATENRNFLNESESNWREEAIKERKKEDLNNPWKDFS